MKDKNSGTNCFPDTSIVRQIVNKNASIKLLNTQFFIVEDGTIDTKLNPCNLPREFQVDNLLVLISGDVKSTFYSGVGPCCTENFEITSILK